MQYWIDKKKKNDEGIFILEGWAIPEEPSDTLQVVVTNGGEAVDCDITYYERSDVAMSILKSAINVNFGFAVRINAEENPDVLVSLYSKENEDDHISLPIVKGALATEKHFAIPRKIVRGVRAFAKADDKKQYIQDYLKNSEKHQMNLYSRWYNKQKVSLHTLRRQADDVFPYMPTISLVVPVYKPKPSHLKAMVASVMNQSYQNWQLCLVNGNGEDIETTKLIRTLTNSDSRIIASRLKENRGISGNTNVGIQMAEGEWVAFADQDDIISPNAFYEYIYAINNDPEIDAIYCDEDKLDDESGKHFRPHFKPDFNLDLLLTNNYICHMFMVRQSIIDEVGPLRKEYDGAQDHDFILRCTAIARKTAHIPKILYSWRSHAASTAQDTGTKSYAIEAGIRSIQSYYDSRHIKAEVSKLKTPGFFYKTDYILDKKPLISILIPNKDHIEDLEKCIHSITEINEYENYEIIIIENNSEDENTFVAYKRLERENPKVRTITWTDGFNYAAINNFAAKEAKGEYLLLLNNDTEFISPDLLTSMAGYLSRPEVGIVGPKLLYKDNTVQHAGVLIGVDHSAFHQFLGYADSDMGYMGRARISQNVSGVTGACLLVKKSIYEEVGGMDESFVVAYNDVDFCLKVEKAGYLCVYDAFVKMYHYESKSRGSDMTEENRIRLDKERDILISKWGKRMNADPHYNINLTLANGYYTLP